MISYIKSVLSEELFLSEEQIKRLVARAPRSYKTYYINKKSGGKRRISQPAKEIKALQYVLINNIFKKLPVHEYASAYKEGASIKNNAKVHATNAYISKFDFKNFFTSIKDYQIKEFLEESTKLNSQDIDMIIKLCCIKTRTDILHLSIGAPSSPILSNAIMYKFDLKISEWANKNGFSYTRYADDMTFSTNKKDSYHLIEKAIRKTIREVSYLKLRLNRKKTLHLSKKTNRSITGIVINNDGKLSLGRKRKRMISATIHAYKIGKLNESELPKLQGLLAFAKDIEPSFYTRMINKYGHEILISILKYRLKEE